MNEPKRRADALRNRAIVLDAAAEIFVEAGADVAMDQIAERAGVGVGTIYRHFPSKDALIEAVMSDHLTRVAEEIEQGLGLADQGGMAGLIRRLAAEVGLKRVLVERLTRQRAGFRSDGLPAVRRLMEVLEKAVDEARERGELRADVTVGDLVAVAVAVAQSPHGDRLAVLALRGMRALER